MEEKLHQIEELLKEFINTTLLDKADVSSLISQPQQSLVRDAV
jgi:hypothetical protein